MFLDSNITQSLKHVERPIVGMNQNQIKLNKPIKSILSYGQRYCNLLEKYQSWDQTFSRYHENGFIIFLSLLSAMYSLITPSNSCEITLLLNLEPKSFCLSLQTSLNKCKGWFGLMHCEGEIQFIFTYTFYFASRIGKKTTKKTLLYVAVHSWRQTNLSRKDPSHGEQLQEKKHPRT